jgi:methylamine--corrinoid protein Co-methyltransferase
MIDFWDVVDRCDRGERMEEADYNLFLWKKLSGIIDKYDIHFDPDHIVPNDDALADRAFEAGMELFLEVGFYCIDNERIVRFTRDEVEERLGTAPSSIVWGEGRDQRVEENRKVEDPRDPFCTFSALGVPVPEPLLLKVSQAMAMEPLADNFCGPSLESTFRGIRLRSGHPVEVAATIWDVRTRRKAAQLAGRPGLALYQIMSCGFTPAAIIASAREGFGALKRDGVLNGAIAELKVNFERMNQAAFLMESGHTIGGLYGPLMGGFAGGPEGTMINQIAHHFLGLFAFNAEFHCCFPIDIRETCNTTAPMLWLSSVYTQAIARNTHLINLCVTMAAGGPSTEVLFYEIPTHAMVATVSGGNLDMAGIARDKWPERTSTLEIRTGAEVGHIVARMGMTRNDINKLVKKLLPRYEKQIPDAPLGKKFSEIYDLERVIPTKEYLELYEKTRKQLRKLGLDYSVLNR